MDQRNVARSSCWKYTSFNLIQTRNGAKMNIKNFGHSDIMSTDWAERERKAALRSMNGTRLRKAASASSGWGIDVARSDARSVGASLDGRGDIRVAWWNFYSYAYLALVPSADLERAMHSFHRMHHAVTLAWLSYVVSVQNTTVDIKERGLLEAVCVVASGKGSQV